MWQVEFEPTVVMTSRFSNAVGWSFVMTGGQQFVTLVMTFVLAGLLGPETFGILAMAIIYLGFIEMLMKQGMVPALIQRPDLSRAHKDAAFWMIMAMAVATTVLSLLGARWWAQVNDTPALSGVIVALSPLLLLSAFSVVQEAILRREMRFKSLALRTNAAAIIGAVVGVSLALAGAGIWALVAQQLTNRVIDVVVLWSVSDWRPRRSFEWARARELLRFSVASAVNGMGVFFGLRIDALLTGLFFGPVAIGLYRLGTRLVGVVVDVAARALQQAALPELARLQGDRSAFRERTCGVVRLSGMLALPSFAVLAASAGTLPFILGDDWAPAVTPLRMLCIVGAVWSLTLVGGAVLNAIGRPQRLAAITWLNAGVGAAAFVAMGIALQNEPVGRQITAMAGSRAALYATFTLSLYALVIGRTADLDMRRLVSEIRPGAIAAALIVGASIGVASLSPLDDGREAFLVAAVSVMVAMCSVPALYPEARTAVRSVLDRRASTPPSMTAPDAEGPPPRVGLKP